MLLYCEIPDLGIWNQRLPLIIWFDLHAALPEELIQNEEKNEDEGAKLITDQ